MKTRNGRAFAHLLTNTMCALVVDYVVWFALTFWVFLQTRSVFATGVVAGLFAVTSVATGAWFGGIVDRHRKKSVMQISAAASLLLYVVALGVYLVTPSETWTSTRSPVLWGFIVLLVVGASASGLASIALTTTVSALFDDDDQRGRANGLVGSASGVAFVVPSAISGFLVAWNGMLGALVIAVAGLALVLAHLQLVVVPERSRRPTDDTRTGTSTVDVKGTVLLVRSIPGLVALVVFSLFNNVLWGGFEAIADPYGLSIMSVQTWGVVGAVAGLFTILSGLVIARTGLGSMPVRLLLLVNAALWILTVLFPLRPSVLWVTLVFAAFAFVMPFAEAAEQTILQTVVPYERQGRVFGLVQSVEQAATPVTTFLVGPLAQFVFMPFMTDGAGVGMFGSWLGTGPDRGLALLFIVMGLLGLALTLCALTSRYYRSLSRRYRDAQGSPAPGGS